MATPSDTVGRKYPLLVYRFIGRRWRPASLVLIFAGALAQIPRFAVSVRPDAQLINYTPSFITTEQLSLFGALLLCVGLALYVGSVWRERRAYVQCLPQYMIISTAGGKIACAYQRINAIKPVKVAEMFPKGELKGGDKRFIRPLAGETALLVDLTDYPLPEAELRKRLSKFVFSTRDKGFVFIVPKREKLGNEIDRYQQRVRSTRTDEQQRYLDPIERLRYQ